MIARGCYVFKAKKRAPRSPGGLARGGSPSGCPSGLLADAAEVRGRLGELGHAFGLALSADAVAGEGQGLEARLGDGVAAGLAGFGGPPVDLSQGGPRVVPGR